MDKALLVVIALIISAVLGIWWQKLVMGFGLTHMLNYPARILRDFEHKLNLDSISNSERRFRGLLFVAIIIIASLFIGWLFSLIFSNPFFTLAILAIFLPVGSSWSRVSSIKKNLKIGNIPAARQQLDGTVFRHHAVMDAPSLARAAIEYLSVQFAEKILSPVFWFILLGVPGLFGSVTIGILNETLAGANNKANQFTKPISGIHFIFNYIPVRLAAFLWVIAALFLPSVNMPSAIREISQEMPMGKPNNIAILCVASSLNLSLGGNSSGYCNDKWIGHGRTSPTNSDITRAQFLFILLCLLLLVSLGPFL